MKATFWAMTVLTFGTTGSVYAQTAAVPEGCDAVATIQKQSCFATTVFECADGKQVNSYQNDELQSIHFHSSTWQIVSFLMIEMGNAEMRAIESSGSNTNLNAAMDAGVETESGKFLLNTGVIKDREYTMSGTLTMSGETLDLNGVTFAKGSVSRVFEINPGDGGLGFDAEIYYAPDLDLFVEGKWTRSMFGDTQQSFDQTPVGLSLPGDSGFLATKSEVGCE
jgi:hypothetical protein